MNPPLWLWFIVGAAPSLFAWVTIRQAQKTYAKKEAESKRELEADKERVRREADRREDQLWGYVDAQGIRHVGVVDTVAELKRAFEEFISDFEQAANRLQP